jgi:hypothetical protein
MLRDAIHPVLGHHSITRHEYIVRYRSRCFADRDYAQGNACSVESVCLYTIHSNRNQIYGYRTQKDKQENQASRLVQQHVSDLKAHSKKKTPVAKISKSMKRTPGAIRQKALSLAIPIGHRR